MISIEDLKRVAKLKGITNIGHAEKDYIIDIALLSISRSTKDELVFKGGTCLYKFYKLDRFSEDMDFTLRKELDVDNLIRRIILDLESFGIEAGTGKKKKAFNTEMINIRAKGPLYNGIPQSISSIGIDINLKSSIDIEPAAARYVSHYPDIPSFSLVVMQEKEILAEKARAIMTRTKARDVFDIWFLLEKGIQFDSELISRKLEYYGQKWDLKNFEKSLVMKKGIWETELGPLIKNVPDYREVKKLILKSLKSQSKS